MSIRLSNFTRILAVILIVAICVAVVPSMADDIDSVCFQELSDAVAATNQSNIACEHADVMCMMLGSLSFFCAAAQAYCLLKWNQAEKAWDIHYECQEAACPN